MNGDMPWPRSRRERPEILSEPDGLYEVIDGRVVEKPMGAYEVLVGHGDLRSC